MPRINPQENRNAHIRRQETRHSPILRPKDIETVDEGEDYESDESEPGAPGLEIFVSVREVGSGDFLGGDGEAEAEVDYAAADPGDEGGCVC